MESKTFFEIGSYHDYMCPTLAREQLAKATKVPETEAVALVGPLQGIESPAAFKFIEQIYLRTKSQLAKILSQRHQDRKFIDERVKACSHYNRKMGLEVHSQEYQTPLGLADAEGRIVFGPLSPRFCQAGGSPVAPIPHQLQGPHVTLFGPPDSAKLAINAVNCVHRRISGEPKIVDKLIANLAYAPKWGADSEDSKTPLRSDLAEAAENLSRCFDGSLVYTDPGTGKRYTLADSQRAVPIKRFPGLALPCTFAFHGSNPIPLHLYDFALHFFKNWQHPESLTFYVPKLETEEEATYLATLIRTAETLLQEQHTDYKLGTIRLMLVVENPRAILRVHEIMDALYPYFAGASLGWHDFLASTARLFKEDPQYRIPVKADPDIVIKYIKASHELIADVVGSRGGIKIGGMYGILPTTNELRAPSFQIALRGFFRDVINQLKRNLDGFWVAHPDFVRIGLAIVEAWRQRDTQPDLFKTLVQDLLDVSHQQAIFDIIEQTDGDSLDKNHPNYVRSLVVADLANSNIIANHHPDEVRYNVFQCLQYLADWLAGNGCVALPTSIDSTPVRVMDDLATAERSRWEVWHEVYHGRFPWSQLVQIAHEELNFIRRDLSHKQKVVHVKWNDRTSIWYPIALRLMLQLMSARKPPEFATELLLPFTVDSIRHATDPWREALRQNPDKYVLAPEVARFHHYFEACGCHHFALAMAQRPIEDLSLAESMIKSFSVDEIIEAASFHGNIGEAKASLDPKAAIEQAAVLTSEHSIIENLRALGAKYLEKFGFKFLIAAKGKSAAFILHQLKERLGNTVGAEITNAREALWEITRQRLHTPSVDFAPPAPMDQIHTLMQQHRIVGAAIAIAEGGHLQSLSFGHASKNFDEVTDDTVFELASLSKSLASVFAVEFFLQREISLDTSANRLLQDLDSPYRIKSPINPSWADQVTLQHLMNHTALNMHYVKGFPCSQKMPRIEELLCRPADSGYEPVQVLSEPGHIFHYSGGGFLVLEHIISALAGTATVDITRKFFEDLGLDHLSFAQETQPHHHYAHGYFANGEEVPSSRLMFPAFAAGAMGTARDMLRFLMRLEAAYHDLRGSGSISHDTARLVLAGSNLGSREFMGCNMGLGIFVTEAGDNKIAAHQGANEGFRALYLHCFAGPDRGKGFVILSNSDNNGVKFIADVARIFLKRQHVRGIDFSKWNESVDIDGVKQEEIVNRGYKARIFDAFQPLRSDEIIAKGPLDPLAPFNLATRSRIISVTNDRFARAENLISPHQPTFDPQLFGTQGKIMDSWESVRHNPLGKDILDLELAQAASVRYISISTQFHDGNHPEWLRLLGRASPADEWHEIIGKTPLAGHSLLQLCLDAPTPEYRQIRIEMYPDGGVSRLGLYSELPPVSASQFAASGGCSQRFQDEIPKSKKPLTLPYVVSEAGVRQNLLNTPAAQIDWASLAFGGKILRVTNEHYSPASQVLSPFPPLHMFDGMESARSRIPDHFEELEIELLHAIYLDRVVLDFTYFVNNNPVMIEGFVWDNQRWQSLFPKTEVKAFAGGEKELRLKTAPVGRRLLLRLHPDGGINRVHVYGRLSHQ